MSRFCEFLGRPDVQRMGYVLSEYRRDLMNAISLAIDQGLSCTGLCCEDVAWAFSWNAASEGFQKKWPPETTQMVEIWAYFSRTRETQKMGKYSYLSEMAWSVCCEERADWHRPGTKLERTMARRTSNECFIPGRLMPYFGLNPRGTDRKDFEKIDSVLTAYYEFWHAYWKPTAAQRFLCLSSILGFINNTYWKKVNQHTPYPSPAPPMPTPSEDATTIPEGEDQSSKTPDGTLRRRPQFNAGELGAFLQEHDRRGDDGSGRYHHCLLEMGCHEKIYADLFFLYGYEEHKLAEIFCVQPPAINRAKSKAIERLLKCEKFRSLFE